MRLRTGTARERGGILIAFALFAALYFGLLGAIIDLGQAFNRRMELQTVADFAALKGAKLLNGEKTGIANAVAAARTGNYQARYVFRPLQLPDSAFSFAASPDAPPSEWKPAATAVDAPVGLLFMRVDASQATSATGVPVRQVRVFFLQLLAPGLFTTDVGAVAVAGRFGGASAVVQLYR